MIRVTIEQPASNWLVFDGAVKLLPIRVFPGRRDRPFQIILDLRLLDKWLFKLLAVVENFCPHRFDQTTISGVISQIDHLIGISFQIKKPNWIVGRNDELVTIRHRHQPAFL